MVCTVLRGFALHLAGVQSQASVHMITKDEKTLYADTMLKKESSVISQLIVGVMGTA